MTDDKKPDRLVNKAGDILQELLHLDIDLQVATDFDKASDIIAQALREEAERAKPQSLIKEEGLLESFKRSTSNSMTPFGYFCAGVQEGILSVCKESAETLHKDSVCKVVSEEELRQIVIEWATKQDPTLITLQPESYFLQGFREAMKMNALAHIEKLWPGRIGLESWLKSNDEKQPTCVDLFVWLEQKLGII